MARGRIRRTRRTTRRHYAAPPVCSGYYFGTVLATGLAFAAGAAVVGGLWGWARPAWGGGYANVNVNRYNNINVNRAQITSNRFQANLRGTRPAGGPVGLPGRGQVQVPGSAVRPATRAASAGGIGGLGGLADPAVWAGSAARVVRVGRAGSVPRAVRVGRAVSASPVASGV